MFCSPSFNGISAPGNGILGYGFVSSGFTTPFPAGSVDRDQISVGPYSLVTSGGINPSAANDFAFALHFDPLSVPEPCAMLLLGSCLAGLAVLRKKLRTA